MRVRERGAPAAAPLIALAVLLLTCTGGTPPSGQASTSVLIASRAVFAVATYNGLFGLDEGGRTLGPIVRLPKDTFPTSPTFDARDGAIVFALIRTTDSIPTSSDIYRVNIDGAGLHPMLEHERTNVFYLAPAIDPAGAALYAQRRVVDLSDLQQPSDTRVVDTIERVDLGTGARRTVVTDGADPGISADGTSLVYVHMNKGSQDGLWTTGVDGAAARPFLRTRDAFVLLQGPRVSPTGRQIVLCSAGHIVTGAPSGGGKLAHFGGISEVFIAPIDGSSLRSIAVLADDVVPTWSRDGSRVAFIALGTLFIVAPSDGAVIAKLSVDYTYGDPVWLK